MQDDGKVRLKSWQGTYLSGSTGNTVSAVSTVTAPDTLFTPEPQLEGSYSFRSSIGTYLVAGGDGGLRSNATQAIPAAVTAQAVSAAGTSRRSTVSVTPGRADGASPAAPVRYRRPHRVGRRW